jgi:hypothetical protein
VATSGLKIFSKIKDITSVELIIFVCIIYFDLSVMFCQSMIIIVSFGC